MVLLSAGFFGFTNICIADDDLIISEILVGGEKADEEFIEIYNPAINSVNLETLPLKLHTLGSSGADTNKNLTFNNTAILANGYFVISSKEYKEKFSGIVDAFYGSGVLAKGWSVYISNSPKKLTGVLDIIKWEECEKNYSYSFNGTDWKCTSLLTPGKENEFDKIPEPTVYSDKIIINELFPTPIKNSGLTEFVELFNGGDADEKLDGWYLKDRAGKLCDLSGEVIETGGFLVIKGNKDKKCTLALNDTQGEVLGLYDPKDNLVSSVSYDGSAKKGKSYSFDGENWRWSQYLTPGEDNFFNNLPVVSAKKENKIYVNTYAQFSAKGSDKDGEKLKFTWDFGDGHKSYKQNTRHKYTKTGDYTATLKVTDGNEDVLTTFKIKVINFPKLKVRIKEVLPNPRGADTQEGGEYIVIKNESGQKINLKDWSVATGSKNLYNHPITRDFILKSGQSKKLTRKYSKFALANQKCKIEIRYPNGKAAYKLKYEKDKIADDEIYKKVDGKWIWIAPLVENKLTAAENPAENIPLVAIKYKDTEMQTNLGKYSESASWRNKKENKIILASYATNLRLPNNLASQGRVLGASTMRDDNEYFAFGRPYSPEPHWAVKFVNALGSKLNQLLNRLLLYL